MKSNLRKLFVLLGGLILIVFAIISIFKNEYDKASTFIGIAILLKLNYPDSTNKTE